MAKVRYCLILLALVWLLAGGIGTAHADDPGGGSPPEPPGPPPVTNITNITNNIFQPDVGSFLEGMVNGVLQIFLGRLTEGTRATVAGLFRPLFESPSLAPGGPGLYGTDFSGLVVPLWQVVLPVAGSLGAILFFANAILYLARVTGRYTIGVGEGLQNVFLLGAGLGLAYYSLQLCNFANELSNALVARIIDSPATAAESFYGLFDTLQEAGSIPLVGIVAGIFSLAAVLALLAMVLARWALLFLLVVISPLALVALGSRGSQRFTWMWAQSLALVLLIGPANALVLRLAFGVAASSAGLPGIRWAIVLGLLAVIIGLNGLLLKRVFGGAMGWVGGVVALATGVGALGAALAAGGGIAALGNSLGLGARGASRLSTSGVGGAGGGLAGGRSGDSGGPGASGSSLRQPGPSSGPGPNQGVGSSASEGVLAGLGTTGVRQGDRDLASENPRAWPQGGKRAGAMPQAARATGSSFTTTTPGQADVGQPPGGIGGEGEALPAASEEGLVSGREEGLPGREAPAREGMAAGSPSPAAAASSGRPGTGVSSQMGLPLADSRQAEGPPAAPIPGAGEKAAETLGPGLEVGHWPTATTIDAPTGPEDSDWPGRNAAEAGPAPLGPDGQESRGQASFDWLAAGRVGGAVLQFAPGRLGRFGFMIQRQALGAQRDRREQEREKSYLAQRAHQEGEALQRREVWQEQQQRKQQAEEDRGLVQALSLGRGPHGRAFSLGFQQALARVRSDHPEQGEAIGEALRSLANASARSGEALPAQARALAGEMGLGGLPPMEQGEMVAGFMIEQEMARAGLLAGEGQYYTRERVEASRPRPVGGSFQPRQGRYSLSDYTLGERLARHLGVRTTEDWAGPWAGQPLADEGTGQYVHLARNVRGQGLEQEVLALSREAGHGAQGRHQEAARAFEEKALRLAQERGLKPTDLFGGPLDWRARSPELREWQKRSRRGEGQ